MFFMAKNIGDNIEDFTRGSPLFWWGVVYRVILNGLGIYTTWTVIASLVNLTTALVYAGEVIITMMTIIIMKYFRLIREMLV